MRKKLGIIFAPKHILLTITVLVSGAVFIFDIIGKMIPTDILWDIVIALLGTLTAGLLVERISYFEPILEELKHFPKSQDSVIKTFYCARTELPKYEDVIKHAKNEIFWVGNIGGTFVERYRGELEKKLVDGCKVKLLMMSPKIGDYPNPLIPLIGNITNNVEPEMRLKYTIATLKKWHTEMCRSNPEAAGRMEVRAYDTLETLVIQFIDADTPDGVINVELIPHQFLANDRPSFDLVGNNSNRGNLLYARLYKQYKMFWDESKPVFSDGGN